MSQRQSPAADTPTIIIDTVLVCASKDGRVYLECSVEGRKAYFRTEPQAARQLASELVYFAEVVDAMKAAQAEPKPRKK
jgi:hypothetical protein